MTTTDNEPIKAEAGMVLHVLAGGVLCFGGAFRRGDVIRLSEEDVEGTRDRNGDSWLDDLSETAQLARWGEVRIRLRSSYAPTVREV